MRPFYLPLVWILAIGCRSAAPQPESMVPCAMHCAADAQNLSPAQPACIANDAVPTRAPSSAETPHVVPLVTAAVPTAADLPAAQGSPPAPRPLVSAGYVTASPAPLPSEGRLAPPRRSPRIQEEILTPPRQGLTLAAALQVALENNPDLVAQRQGEPAGRAVLDVARTYPFNPVTQVQVLPLSQTRTGGSTAVSHYVLLWQTLELAHQRTFREGAAAADLNRIRWTIHQSELVTLAQSERLYATAIYQRQIRDVLLHMADLNEQLAASLQRLFDAAQAAGGDVSLARIQARTSRQQAELAEANYQTALLDLGRQLGLPACALMEPTEKLTGWSWSTLDCVPVEACPAPCGDRLGELVAGRPDVMAALADVASTRAALGLATAGKVPNLIIGPYYQRDDFGTTAVGLRAWSEVPVVNTGQPLVRQRFAELRARQATFQQLQVRARLEAQAAISRYQRAREIVERTVPTTLREMEDEVRHVENQFQAGQSDLLRVYAARTAYVQGYRACLDTLNELAQAAANVTAATSLPPSSIVGAGPALDANK